MRKNWVIFLLAAVILIIPVIVTAAFTFGNSFKISEPTLLVLLGFLLLLLGVEGLRRLRP